MADQASPNIVTLLRDLVGAVVMQQAQIAELQADRTTLLETGDRLTAAVASLEEQHDTLKGDAGLASQLGDLSAVPVLRDQLTAALPAPAADPAPSAPEQQAA